MIKLIKLFFLIFIISSSTAFASSDLRAYEAIENKDYKKALFYLSYDANLGDDRAQYNLGIMYKKGLGVSINNNEAFGWFFLSAEQGNILANYALGNSYNKGEGVKKNYPLAYKAFKYASLREHPLSKINLGAMYFFGNGIQKDYSKAYLWWRLSADLNINGARKNIEMLSKKMNDNEKNKGLQLYEDCMKNTLFNCTKNY